MNAVFELLFSLIWVMTFSFQATKHFFKLIKNFNKTCYYFSFGMKNETPALQSGRGWSKGLQTSLRYVIVCSGAFTTDISLIKWMVISNTTFNQFKSWDWILTVKLLHIGIDSYYEATIDYILPIWNTFRTNGIHNCESFWVISSHWKS